MGEVICPFVDAIPIGKRVCKEECGVWNPIEKRCSIVVISTKLSKAVELLTEIASAVGKD